MSRTQVTTLANGLRVVSHRMPQSETVSLGLWVGVGARHETEAEHGISHFLEHMAFKGTATRTARDIANEIEHVGGDLNAATSPETTSYYARVLKGDEGLALELLADILLRSSYNGDEMEREREVILQELASTLDNPEDIALDLLHEAAYPDQGLGRPILGTVESVRRFVPDDLRTFLQTHYRSDRMVLAAAGAIRHDKLVRHAEALFGGLSRGRAATDSKARFVGGSRVNEKAFEQAHVMLGFEGPSYAVAGYYTMQVLSSVLGGGMSSRLFQEVRERRGLCYSIYSSAWGLKDTGMLYIHSATGAKSVETLIDVVGQEMRAMAEKGPDAAEMQRARAQMKAGLMMGLESASGRTEQMARQLLAFDRLLERDELIANVERVGPQQVKRLARKLLESPLSVAIVGAGRKSGKYAIRAERLGAAANG